jgi:NADH/NAD ratio-sensing transcriptional regulator Rex
MRFDVHIHHHGSAADACILQQLDQIKEILMSTQADIDALTQQVNAATAEIVQKIEEESQQVQDFIASHPDIDTSALESAVAGLNSIAESVDNIMPDAPVEPEPVPEG